MLLSHRFCKGASIATHKSHTGNFAPLCVAKAPQRAPGHHCQPGVSEVNRAPVGACANSAGCAGPLPRLQQVPLARNPSTCAETFPGRRRGVRPQKGLLWREYWTGHFSISAYVSDLWCGRHIAQGNLSTPCTPHNKHCHPRQPRLWWTTFPVCPLWTWRLVSLFPSRDLHKNNSKHYASTADDLQITCIQARLFLAHHTLMKPMQWPCIIAKPKGHMGFHA